MRFYYEKIDGYRIYDTETTKFTTVSKVPYDKNIYYVFEGYASDEGVLRFINDFGRWVEEIKSETKIDYFKLKSHEVAIPMMCKFMCPRLNECEEIDVTEAQWMEKCNNSGIQLMLQKGKNECYGYDFKAFYLSMMGKNDLHLDIPIKCGKEQTLKELDYKNLKVGMYHVKITSDDKRFLFAYSADNVYTNITLYHAFKCKQSGMNVTIELIQDDKPNAYIYGTLAKDGIHKSGYLFQNLYDKLIQLKISYPKNKLVKFICSSIWGHICRFNVKYYSLDKVIDDDIDCTMDKENKNADYWIRNFDGDMYELVSIKRPYKYNVARIKPFLLSKGQVITANVASLHIDDVVRLHTDGIVFNKKHDDVMTKFKTYPQLIAEEKTSGLIDWQSVNSYYNFTTKESHGKYKAL
jgi:hypothetical protein